MDIVRSVGRCKMEINKKDLKKTSRRFRQLASRVLNAYFKELNSNIKIFIEYIDSTPVINEYIESIYVDCPNLNEKIEEITKGYYTKTILSTGNTPEQEISFVYQILKFVSENPSIEIFKLGMGYTSSTKYQDMAKEFGNRIVNPFVDEINNYLMDIATDMGYDEESRFMVHISGGQAQVNISNDNSTLNATQNVQINESQVDDVISELKRNLETELADKEEMKNLLLSQIKLIESEKMESKPKKEVLKTAINTIQSLLKTVPLATAAIESGNKLYQLVVPFLN